MAFQEPSKPDLTDESLQNTPLISEADDTDAILPSIGLPLCKSEGSGPKIRRPSHCAMHKPKNCGDASSETSSRGTDEKMTIETLHETQLTGGPGCIASTNTDHRFASLSACPDGFNLVDDELMSSTAEVPLSFTPFSTHVNLEGEELTSSTGFVPVSQGASLAEMPKLLACLQNLQPVADVDDETVDDSALPRLDSPSPELSTLCSLTASIAEPVTRQQASSIVRPRPVSDAEVEAALNTGRLAKHLQMKGSSTPQRSSISNRAVSLRSCTAPTESSARQQVLSSISQKSSISNRAVSPRSCAAPTESSARKQVAISHRSVTPLRAVTPPRNLASGSYTSLSPFPAATFGKASREDFRPPRRPSPGRSPSPDAYRGVRLTSWPSLESAPAGKGSSRKGTGKSRTEPIEACAVRSSGCKSGPNRRCR